MATLYKAASYHFLISYERRFGRESSAFLGFEKANGL